MASISEMKPIMNYLAAAYPAIPVSAETTAVFVEALAELPADVVFQAVKEHVKVSRFFPTVAEIRKVALRHMHPQDAFAVINGLPLWPRLEVTT